jgi:hypothetical protein
MMPFLAADVDAAQKMTYEDVKKIFPDITRESFEKVMKESQRCACYLNDVYQVMVRPLRAGEHGFGENVDMVHLSIKRIDKQPIHDWRDLQQIKNELIGPECEAMEIYPAESRLVDTANQFHLWCFIDPEVRLPVGFPARYVNDDSVGGAHQRPRQGGND